MLLNLFVFMMEFGFVFFLMLVICFDMFVNYVNGYVINVISCRYDFVYFVLNKLDSGILIVVLDFFMG